MSPTDAPDAVPPSPTATSRFTVASFNLHAGIDGWGRPFDAVAAVGYLDADVVVLQENWTPSAGEGIAAAVGRSLGYTVFEHPFVSGRLARPHPQADDRWMKRMDWRGAGHALYLDGEVPFSPEAEQRDRYRNAEPGTWGVAVLSRLPARPIGVVELGRLKRDRARRYAVVVEIEVAGRPVAVVGTHMSHVTYGAPSHFLRLSRAVRDVTPTGPAVLAGDMNLWGPPVSAFFPRWRRTVRGRTWPAWRPHSQIDHILVRGDLRVEAGRVCAPAGSDHLPIRVQLAIPG